MKRSEIITQYSNAIKEAMIDRYQVVLECEGRIQYKIYVWEDGEIEMLEGCQGDNTYLQPKSGESRELYYVTTISSPCFYAFDYTDDPEPDDETEREKMRKEIIDYLVDEYRRAGVDDVLNAIQNEDIETY